MYIPTGIVSIQDSAFKLNNAILSITIPSTVTSIGSDAFSNCLLLNRITILSVTVSISTNAFTTCPELNRVIMPITLKNANYESSAYFGPREDIEYIYIEPSVKLINDLTGEGILSETEVGIQIETATEVTISSDVLVIGLSAFANRTTLVSIKIISYIENIEDSAFENCQVLTQINIPESVTSIG